MTAPIRSQSGKTIMQGMIEQRRLTAHARCRVKNWRLTELQARQLADEMWWLQPPIRAYLTSYEIVEAMKRGEIYMFGASVTVQ